MIDTQAIDATDAAAYIGEAKRGRLNDLDALRQVIDGEGDLVDEAVMLGLGIGAEYDDHELQQEPSADDAECVLDTYALAVESALVVEVVLGTGGPDDRLVFECSLIRGSRPDTAGAAGEVAIRRVLYRYTWAGSAEVELVGEDRRIAEEYGRRVVPELAE
jgi:hypothetical protein